MIKKLETHTISGNGIRQEIIAPQWEMFEKINEIIEVVNKLEEDKVSRKSNERSEESAVKSEFIRDMTSVVPRPKSEVRRRLEEILQAERTRIIKALEELKLESDIFYGRCKPVEALDQAIKAVEEKE